MSDTIILSVLRHLILRYKVTLNFSYIIYIRFASSEFKILVRFLFMKIKR